jgi:cadmium resistance protein CadD (predicted permease)
MILFAFAPNETVPEKIAIMMFLLMPVFFGIKYLRERWKEERNDK